MMLAILCPTRDRPEQFKRMVESVDKTTVTNPVYVFTGSNGGKSYAHKQYPEDIPTVYMWNDLAQTALANPSIKLFMLGADDMIFTTPGWDKALLDHYDALENKIHVYALQDSRDQDGTPHPIVTREYIESMGYFLPPLFMHWFVDSWTVDVARSNNCFTHLKNFELIHDKPSDKGNGDETHNRIRRMGWRERDGVVNRDMRHVLENEKVRLHFLMKGHELVNVQLKHGDLDTIERVCNHMYPKGNVQ